MFQPLRRELLSLEEGVMMRDQSLGKDVLVVAPVLLAKCDKPRAAELLGHMGAQAKKYVYVHACLCMHPFTSIYCVHMHIRLIVKFRLMCLVHQEPKLKRCCISARCLH